MITRTASVIVCDEMLVSLTGKLTIAGLYTGDIGIASDPGTTQQLVFLFVVEGPIEDPVRTLEVEVTLPGEKAIRMPVAVTIPDQVPPGRRNWTIRWPVLMIQPTLRPGRISAKVIHDKGEIEVATPWVTIRLPPTQAPSN